MAPGVSWGGAGGWISSPPMRTITRVLTTTGALLAVVLTVVLTAGPALATESGAAGGAGEPSKLQLPDNPHDRVGLILLALGGLAGLVAAVNAINQLRGRRPRATGEWRWR